MQRLAAKFLIAFSLSVLAVPAAHALDAAVPIGTPIVVGRSADSCQIASDAAGNFVVVWTDPVGNLLARRFSADGAPVGAAFVVLAAPSGSTSTAEVPVVSADVQLAMNAKGDFVVAWREVDRKSSVSLINIHFAGPVFSHSSERNQVHVRSYAADGRSLTNDLVVASYRMSPTFHVPKLAIDSEGNFTLSYLDLAETVRTFNPASDAAWDAASSALYVDRYSATGVPLWNKAVLADIELSAYFGVISASGTIVDSYSIGSDDRGNALLAWLAFSVNGKQPNRINAAHYSADGQRLGAQIDLAAGGPVGDLALGVNGSGRYALAWNTGGPISYLRIGMADGSPSSAAIPINDDALATLNSAAQPSLAISANGSVVTAIDDPTHFVGTLRFFSADGVPLTSSTPLPPAYDGRCCRIALAMDAAGNAITAYANTYDNDAGYTLLVQRYAHP